MMSLMVKASATSSWYVDDFLNPYFQLRPLLIPVLNTHTQQLVGHG